MNATVQEVLALADVEKCLKDTGVDSTTGHCHNACVWLMIQIKRHHLSDYNICCCVGTFWGRDHSWLLVEDTETNEHVVIDMTVNQFVDRPVPYSGPMTDEYNILDSVNLCDEENFPDFVNRMG